MRYDNFEKAKKLSQKIDDLQFRISVITNDVLPLIDIESKNKEVVSIRKKIKKTVKQLAFMIKDLESQLLKL